MKYVADRWVSYNPETGTRSYNPWYLGKGLWGGRLVDESYLEDGGEIPSSLGIAYRRWDMKAVVMYPKPLHLIARFLHYSVRYYWGVMRLLYWVGLIDTGQTEAFRWADFYRIKVH